MVHSKDYFMLVQWLTLMIRVEKKHCIFAFSKYMNNLQIGQLPHHGLKLKEMASIMLQHNSNQTEGLC